MWSTRWILSLILALIAILAGFYYGSDLIDALYTVDPYWVIWGIACYAVNYSLRAIRFRILSNKAIKFWPEGLHAACFHGFATYMMPFRSGEMTLPIVLRSTSGLNLTEGSRILVQARLLDLQILGMWIVLAALLADIQFSKTMMSVWLAMGIAMMTAPTLIRRLASSGRRSGYRLFAWFGRFADAKPTSSAAKLTSAGIWMMVAGCYFCAARSIGLPLDLIQVWVLISIQLPMQLIPVQGIANAGNHEGGWVAGLLLLGVPAKKAMEFALLSHVIILAYVLALAPAALITGYCCPEKKTH